MKNAVIFGAAGHTGKYITRRLMKSDDIKLTAFVRDPKKFGDMDITGVNIVCGDALNEADVKKAMEKQDILICSLEGDVLTMAQNIVSALKVTSVKRIIRITGMGIHHEITEPRSIMLNMYAKKRPEYIKAADLIAASGAVITLLRCPGIQDGDNEKYCLTTEREQPAHRNVDRATLAQCIADMIASETLGANESFGITN